MKSFTRAILLALAVAGFASPAAAWPYIDVTASEGLSVDPPRVRTTFEISIVGYQPSGFQEFFIFPNGPEPRPELFDCTTSEGWGCNGENLPLALLFFQDEPFTSFPHTFSIISDQEAPCVRFLFLDVLLARSPSPRLQTNYEIEACLVLDAPVPAAGTTWGGLKATYR